MIVLDTHTWIWFISNPELLSVKAKRSIKTSLEERSICISSISVLELALLVKRNRLKLTMDASEWISRSESLPFIKFIPINNSIALKSVNLPAPFHDDPADRIIISTSISLGAPLITKDERILNYPHVQTIW